MRPLLGVEAERAGIYENGVLSKGWVTLNCFNRPQSTEPCEIKFTQLIVDQNPMVRQSETLPENHIACSVRAWLLFSENQTEEVKHHERRFSVSS
jgi:hypothetical protein